MSRLGWVFVLLAVVGLSNARPDKCEQSERLLADLDLMEGILKRAKQLVPNCGTTGEPSTRVTTVEPSTKFTTGEPTPEVPKEDIRRPMDCQELQADGVVMSGVYTVWPRGKSVQVRCDMDTDTDGGGWTVIQRRGKFLKQLNFDRDWKSYKNGFGNLQEEFWLGNDHIFALSNQGNYSLRMDMTAADGESAYALFKKFRIEDEEANYKLRVFGYSGTAGDSMWTTDGQMFSTKDRKYKRNFGSCAEILNGGWWQAICTHCLPNGSYKPGVKDQTSMHYWTFKGRIGLSSIEMKIKRL